MLTNKSYDGKKISIRWKPPYEGNSPILDYVLLLYKPSNVKFGVILNKINTYHCNKYCEYTIDFLLEQNQTYALGIRARNSFGIGELSNIITFTTKPRLINTDILGDIEYTDYTLNDDNVCSK